jgi:hypothetical protein
MAVLASCPTGGRPGDTTGLHLALGSLGGIPIIGIAFDAADAVLSAVEGDIVGVGLSLGAMVPFAGDALFNGAKVAKAGARLIGGADEVAAVGRVAGGGGRVAAGGTGMAGTRRFGRRRPASARRERATSSITSWSSLRSVEAGSRRR